MGKHKNSMMTVMVIMLVLLFVVVIGVLVTLFVFMSDNDNDRQIAQATTPTPTTAAYERQTTPAPDSNSVLGTWQWLEVGSFLELMNNGVAVFWAEQDRQGAFYGTWTSIASNSFLVNFPTQDTSFLFTYENNRLTTGEAVFVRTAAPAAFDARTLIGTWHWAQNNSFLELGAGNTAEFWAEGDRVGAILGTWSASSPEAVVVAFPAEDTVFLFTLENNRLSTGAAVFERANTQLAQQTTPPASTHDPDVAAAISLLRLNLLALEDVSFRYHRWIVEDFADDIMHPDDWFFHLLDLRYILEIDFFLTTLAIEEAFTPSVRNRAPEIYVMTALEGFPLLIDGLHNSLGILSDAWWFGDIDTIMWSFDEVASFLGMADLLLFALDLTSAEQRAVTTSNLNLRQSPSATAASLGVVPADSDVEVLQVINSDWVRVRTFSAVRDANGMRIGDQIGYMALEFLKMMN